MTHLIEAAYDALNAQNVLNNLLEKCQIISKSVIKKVTCNTSVLDPIQNNAPCTSNSMTTVSKNLMTQPKILNENMQLKSYQVFGMNWLVFMQKEGLNSILADEMGLGKTCQSIALLAYLHQKNKSLLNMIIVPASTLENWSRELANWCPKLKVQIYRGSPEDRVGLRRHIIDLISRKAINIILTTYK